jgi:aspartokinase-like uncharacterized kinase
MSLVVVKLGGSLANSDELPQWLDVIAAAGAGKAVLVPGGGAWADEVQEAQKREGFDDSVAHCRALLAMEQYGQVLSGMRVNFVLADDIPAIHEVLRNEQVAVWMPYEMVVADASIPQTWDVTSDSLSAWLACKLGAALLVLVKSMAVSDPKIRAGEMMKKGWVDACFGGYCAAGNFQYRVFGTGDHRQLARILAGHIADTPPDQATGSGR